MTEPKQNVPKPPAIYRALAAALGWLEDLLGLDCRRFTRLASEHMDRALTFGERFKYRLHRLICGVCRQQDNRNRCLSELFKRANGDAKLCGDAALSPDAKAKLRQRLQEESQS